MKILIAEDDINIRQGLFDMLQAEGYEVIAAENGKIALDYYQQSTGNNAPDFIILDVMMPEMDGFSVCRAIRRYDEQIPILFLTAKSEEIDKVLGLELGADDYISKPFSLAELRARIKTIARRCLSSKKNQSCTFIFGDLKVFPNELRAKRIVKNEEHVIELSFREIKLLTCLHENEGQVVSRDMLFDAAWGYEHLPNSRTLDQHISKLRKHIELDSTQPQWIQTVHGRGYRYAYEKKN